VAELSVFSFRPGASLLHKLDVRFKIVFLILISLTSLSGGAAGLGILTGLLAALGLQLRLPLKSGLKELRFFILLMLLIIAARMLTTPGETLIAIHSLALTRPGLISGTLVCWRLAIIALMGFLFVFTTPSAEIKAAVQWFFKPFGFIPGQRIATMMGLIARFVPVILNQAKETVEAQRARCVENRKNPLQRLIRLGLPLIRRTFVQADKMAIAMEARCYVENRTDPELAARRIDWLALGVMLVIGSVVVIL
jgi:energy-coupling factor transporter transmembrane protein EcfT